jgi:exoribonuclease-2
MAQNTFRAGSLVLYKNHPARVISVGRKIEIELEGGEVLSVRPKDIRLLHPGPLVQLSELKPQAGEVHTAWELLAGRTTSLAELTELIYGEFNPATAWAAWELLEDSLYFHGSPDGIVVRLPEEVAQEKAAREAKAAKERAWAGFLERVRSGSILPKDRRRLRGVEALALGQRTTSRVLRELGRAERPENAHALLLELGYWDYTVNPYPRRLGLGTSPPESSLPELPEEARLDLTHLSAFAIDDEGNQDPDDALSLEGNRLWVHVADVAALVRPDSRADLEARAHGANLYLPEGTVPMLPPEATAMLGLGLRPISPALSFGLDLNSEGEVINSVVQPTWVRVTRLTYAQAEERLHEEPFRSLHRLATLAEARRLAAGAISIDLPEIKIQVVDDQVIIHPLHPLKSRALVTEAMLMAGEAMARFAIERSIPFAFSSQAPPAPGTPAQAEGLAGMYALRRSLQRSQLRSTPTPHAGLGLPVYTQTTSPLRRYMDLVAHQQLRAFLQGEDLLDSQALLERIGAAQAMGGDVRLAERLSRRHWTLVYLLQHPNWRGKGVLVEKEDTRAIILIPELDLEPRVHLRAAIPLNSEVPLSLSGVDLPELEAHFRLEV